MYCKKIIYLELHHKSTGGWELPESEKIGTAGFMKLEIREGRLDFSIQLRVVQTVLPDGEKEIVLERRDGTSYPAGSAMYRGGSLQLRSTLAAEKEDGFWRPEDIRGIRIALSEAYEVVGRMPVLPNMTPVSAEEGQEQRETDSGQPLSAAEEALTAREQEGAEEALTDREQETAEGLTEREQEAVQEAFMSREPAAGEYSKSREKSRLTKWEELQEQYTCVHPFQDERVYLSLTPEDFLLFSEADYLLRYNRFLLHGYENYRHLILGKMADSTGKEEYYIGVPGLFYEQEKNMAILFGFEGFESRSLRPTDGTFGYYMKRILL